MSSPLPQPDESPLAEQLFETLGALRRQTRRLAGRPWPATSLSSAQVELVRLVRREPGIPVSGAAVALGLAPNTVSTLVRQLTDAGVLLRTVDSGDRRVARLQVTSAARRRIEGWRDQRAELATAGLARLGADDREAIAAALPALGRLASVLAEQREAHG